MRHFLDIDDLSADEMIQVLDFSEEPSPPPVMAGKGAALIFEKPSNRTRNASEMAVFALGGHPVTIRGEDIGMGVRESVNDVIRVLSQYHAVVGARVYDHQILAEMAAIDVVPIVNLLSDVAHPTQALADVLTLRQHWGSFDGRRVAWIGDGNNVARSLLLACARAAIDVRLASPTSHQVDPTTVAAARAFGIDVELTVDPFEAADKVDAVFTDTWVSMGQEAAAAERFDLFGRYTVDGELMAAAQPGAVFLHCLPAHRGQEVTADVLDGPSSLVWLEAANRMHTVRGLLRWLLGT